MNRKMNRLGTRIFQALLIALFVMTSYGGSAFAQSTPSKLEDARVVMQDGWSARARFNAADSFALVCPTLEVLDPNHPCSDASIVPVRFDDYVLVCPGPGKELPGDHPCNQRSDQIQKARPQDFVLVCPAEGKDLPGDHPCNQSSANRAGVNSVQFKMPRDFVMTCPTKEVLDRDHPCSESNRSSGIN